MRLERLNPTPNPAPPADTLRACSPNWSWGAGGGPATLGGLIQGSVLECQGEKGGEGSYSGDKGIRYLLAKGKWMTARESHKRKRWK